VSQSSPRVVLAEGDITRTDRIAVELVTPNGMPAIVRITWPEQLSVVDPKLFGDTAAAVVKLFSAAHVELARRRARRHLS
jgi:hypothetical protein